jgi:SAM-dependent methyltransferase
MSSATREDVISCYRVLLEREPESEAVISAHLKSSPSVLELVKRFLTGREFISRFVNPRAGEFNFYYSAVHRIDLNGTAEQLQKLHDHVCQVWTRLGDENPHWSVLTSPQYYHDRMTPEIENGFYETGELEVRAFIAACVRNGIAPNFAGTIVDLGCGVGRLGVHLSEKFHKYIGVDVSTRHLSLAQSRLKKIGRSNVELRLLPDFLSGTDAFDTFLSLLVLQHNPPPIISNLLREVLARLNPGGIAFFQVPSVLFNYNFHLAEYLQSIGDAAGMEMHALPQQRIFEILAMHDCQPVEVIFDGKAGELGISYSFLAKKG